MMVEFTELNLRAAKHSTNDLHQVLNNCGYGLFTLNTELFRLEPFIFDGPIWYDNLFAVQDVGTVNARLDDAPSAQREIAKDIVARGRAAMRIKNSSPRSGKGR